MIQTLKEKIKHHFSEVFREKRSPNSIGIGFSTGTFISIVLPIPLFNVLVALLVILIFERVNKIALGAAMLFWNIFTLTPVYLLSYYINKNYFGLDMPLVLDLPSFKELYSLFQALFISNLILGVLISLLVYFPVRKAAEVYYKRKAEREKNKSQDPLI